ncbi:MAG: hypothetical protein WBE68_10250 [Candidatus Nitrosopolaris sp.]
MVHDVPFLEEVINALALHKSTMLLTFNRIREYAEVFEYFSKI